MRHQVLTALAGILGLAVVGGSLAYFGSSRSEADFIVDVDSYHGIPATTEDPWPPIPTPPPPLPTPTPFPVPTLPVPFPPKAGLSQVPTPPPPLPTPTAKPGSFEYSQSPLTQSSPTLYTAVLDAYLMSLDTRGFNRRQQSIVLASASGHWLAAHRPHLAIETPVFDRIWTSLAALRTWQPDHRFEMRVFEVGSLEGTTLDGNLMIEGELDPLLLSAEPNGLVHHLQALGIRRVTDGVHWVQSGYHGQKVTWLKVQALKSALSDELDLGNGMGVLSSRHHAAAPLIRHISPPLVDILYSQHDLQDPQITDLLTANLSPRPDTLLSSEIALDVLAQLHMGTEGKLGQILPEMGMSTSLGGSRDIPLGTLIEAGSLTGEVRGLASVGQLPNGLLFVMVNQGSDLDELASLQDRFLNDVMLVNPE